MNIVTARAPSNIAVIKYWGKRDEKLILPLNSSISLTVSVDQMSATTSVALSEDFHEDKIWLNGIEEDVDNTRIQNCLREFRQLLVDKEGPNCPMLKCRVHICSENNFPTAAGLASSAAGYACLVYTLAQVYGLENHELTRIARQGSGSACRSMFGGFVKWEAGTCADGQDSVASQLFPANHWQNLKVLILVVDTKSKTTSSTGGMLSSTKTSSLLPHRCNLVLPDRIQNMEDAIRKKDFQSFAEITMKDSNQFHAICQDTFPPIRYMNDNSWEVVNLIHQYNEFHGSNKVAYSFDAGANCVLFVLESDVSEILALVSAKFPQNPEARAEKFYVGLPFKEKTLPLDLLVFIKPQPIPGAIKYIIHTKVGGGPEIIQNHLLNDEGNPNKLKEYLD